MTSFPASLLVDLDAIRSNTAVLREHAGAAEVMAVVKADGYGHGLIESAQAALRGGATWLGVAQVSEGLALRAAGITAPILAWLYSPQVDLGPAVAAGIDLAVSAPWAVDQVAEAARMTGQVARVHLKVDTGLGRNGAAGPDIPILIDAAARAAAEGGVEPIGIMTHFAFADAPDHPTVQRQVDVFAEAVAAAEAQLPITVRHMANSAATLTNPSLAYDLVRPGLAVYGLSPVPGRLSAAQLGLTPAMTLRAEVALVKRVPAGTGISYAHTYVTPRETTVVDVPLGYSDGVPRAASNSGPVAIAGQRFTVAGRVCMDQLMVDVGDLAVSPGDEVVFFGSGKDGGPTADDWAAAAGTIHYEIITRVGTRIPREYV